MVGVRSLFYDYSLFEAAREMNVTLETIIDRWDSRITDFRQRLFTELGVDGGNLNIASTRSGTLRKLDRLSASDAEEIWKFSDAKWIATKFDALECALVAGRVVSLSGCRFYGNNMLRVGMHLYTLKEFRREVRNIQFRKNGFFARHLEFARNSEKTECLFMTVYAHNSKLKSHAKNLASRRISPDGGPMEYIHDLEFVPEPIVFHDVPQYFFLYKLNPDFNLGVQRLFIEQNSEH